MCHILVLNLTRLSFFCYTKNDKGYNKIVRDLLVPLTAHDISTWKRSDKIIIVPSQLNDFVYKNYKELLV